jgi:hypothetical protein
MPIVYSRKLSSVPIHDLFKNATEAPRTIFSATLRDEAVSAAIQSRQYRFKLAVVIRGVLGSCELRGTVNCRILSVLEERFREADPGLHNFK